MPAHWFRLPPHRLPWLSCCPGKNCAWTCANACACACARLGTPWPGGGFAATEEGDSDVGPAGTGGHAHRPDSHCTCGLISSCCAGGGGPGAWSPGDGTTAGGGGGGGGAGGGGAGGGGASVGVAAGPGMRRAEGW
eukprot:186692-Rhodomonas_salina.1